MVSVRTDELLTRGGMVVSHNRPGADEESGETESQGEVSKYNGALDPAGAEMLGRRLAERLAPRKVDAVLVWEDVEDLVLAHVVARELDVAVVRAFDDGGLVRSVGELRPGDSVAVVADTCRDASVVQALGSLVGLHGATLVAIGCLVDFTLPDIDADQVVSLGLTVAEQPGKGPR